MKVIYDKKTGYIYTTAYTDGEINPAVLDVDVPSSYLISKIKVEDGKEPVPEFYKTTEQVQLEELKKVFEDKVNELTEKLNTTDLAVAELTMNTMQ